MSESKHTPGPWSFDHDWHRLPTIFAADRKTMVAIIEGAQRDHPTPAHEANAALIAAAPELLDAVKRARRHAMNIGVNDGSYVAQLDAAIASAEGRAP